MLKPPAAHPDLEAEYGPAASSLAQSHQIMRPQRQWVLKIPRESALKAAIAQEGIHRTLSRP